MSMPWYLDSVALYVLDAAVETLSDLSSTSAWMRPAMNCIALRVVVVGLRFRDTCRREGDMWGVFRRAVAHRLSHSMPLVTEAPSANFPAGRLAQSSVTMRKKSS